MFPETQKETLNKTCYKYYPNEAGSINLKAKLHRNIHAVLVLETERQKYHSHGFFFYSFCLVLLYLFFYQRKSSNEDIMRVLSLKL